jgi:hypothetical protein
MFEQYMFPLLTYKGGNAAALKSTFLHFKKKKKIPTALNLISNGNTFILYSWACAIKP